MDNLCHENNVHYAANFINGELISKGYLNTALELDETDKELPSIINTLYALMQEKSRSDAAREALIEQSRKIEAESDHVRTMLKDAKNKAAQFERSAALLGNDITSLRQELNSSNEKLKNTKEELTKSRQALKNVKTQCANELRKKEKDTTRLQERLAKITDDKFKSKGNLLYEIRTGGTEVTDPTTTYKNVPLQSRTPSDVWKSLGVELYLMLYDILAVTVDETLVHSTDAWRDQTLDAIHPEQLKSAFESIILKVHQLASDHARRQHNAHIDAVAPSSNIKTAKLEKENAILRGQLQRYEQAMAAMTTGPKFPEFRDDDEEDSFAEP